jgi:hypothetical protein
MGGDEGRQRLLLGFREEKSPTQLLISISERFCRVEGVKYPVL